MCDECAQWDEPTVPMGLLARADCAARLLADKKFAELQKEGPRIEAIRGSMVRMYRRQFRDAARRGVADVLTLVHQVDALDALNADDVLATLEQHLSADNLGTSIAARAAGKVQSIYSLAAGAVKRGYRISGTDHRAIRTLANHDILWIRDHYNDELTGKFRDITTSVMQQGYSRTKLAQALADGLGGVVDGDTHYWSMLADNTTTRAREVGRVTGFEAAGIKQARVQRAPRAANAKPCICDDMDGKVIQVAHLRGQVNRILAATSTSGLRAAIGAEHRGYAGGGIGLPSNLGVPQYHPKCKCTLMGVV